MGIGTVIAVFGIGTIMEYTFKILHFDVRNIKHGRIQPADTVKRIRGGKGPEEAPGGEFCDRKDI